MQHFNLRQLDSVLLIPLVDINLNLMNLQRITPNGAKRFLPGGKITGCFSLLGNITEHGSLYVCEGWATGATIHQVTGHPVACAMNCGNLKSVAAALRQKHPTLTLTIAGDDDRNTEGNPGRAKAIEAAKQARALVTTPEFCRPDCGCTDFNDVYLCRIGGAQ
jgi:putative DNA primase/helicase